VRNRHSALSGIKAASLTARAQVFDYVTGKVDWLAGGLPTEGKEAHALRAKDCVRRDMPTCRLTDRLGDIRHRVQAAGQEDCVVLNDAGILSGYLGGKALDAAPQTTVDQVMEPGPSTIRPHVSLAEIAPYMRERDIDRILVTTAAGQWMGVLHRRDAEQRLGEVTLPFYSRGGSS
jgi:signal-transduction protein with cAMP-binding, CBS, and nucleotidyltransferase domain